MVNSLKNIKMRPGDTKVSFDVVSLFTKVPKKETLEYIKQRLTDFDDLDNWTKLNTDEIMELLNICICSTYFKFNDNFFKQLEGTAMGSPISPIFAELFLQKLENNLIKNNRNIIVWRRYVDDVSTL
jgi:retron-type reverse transcriptase